MSAALILGLVGVAVAATGMAGGRWASMLSEFRPLPAASTPSPSVRPLKPGSQPVFAPTTPTTTPCPQDLHMSSDQPNSSLNYHCETQTTDNSGGSTNISVSNSSSQTSTGGTSSNHNSVDISVTNR